MKSALLCLVVLFVTGISAPTPVSAQTSVSSRRSATLHAELTHGIDARRARVGDPVLARCTSDFLGRGEVRIPKNAKLIGHVVEVQRKTKAHPESTLGIAFDRALMRDGREVRLTATLQAIAPSATMADESDDGLPGEVQNLAPASARSPLSADSTGVIGLKGLELDNSASSSASGSVIRSNSQNVRLEGGTRLILRVSLQ